MEKEIIITVLPRSSIEVGMFGTHVSEYQYERLSIWADKGYIENFKRIKGVLQAYNDDTEYRYFIAVDPRYNLQWVIREIEAVVKTQKPIRKRKSKSDNGDDND